MVNTLKKVKPIEGDWLARDGDQWRVNIPIKSTCGHKVFPYAEYGGVAKAYEQAAKFQRKMLTLLEQERDFYRKHGVEMEGGNKLHMRNRTGVTGLAKTVKPNRYEKPLIEYRAAWGPMTNRKYYIVSTAQHPESECIRLAKLALEYKTTHPETLLKLKGKNKRGCK